MAAPPVQQMAMFPLGMALLPGELLPLQIFEPRYREMLAHCLESDDPKFGVVLIARGAEVGGSDERHMIATSAVIVEHHVKDDGRALVRCVGTDRLRVVDWLPDDPYPRALVEDYPDEPIVSFGAESLDSQYAAVADRIRELFELVRSAGRADVEFDDTSDTDDLDDVDRAFRWAGQLPIGQADRYEILAAPSPLERIEALGEAVESVTAAIRFQLMD
ncbi:MAG: LON peptidase substrate-binding domain-containing protein [Williamsia herbipolensis]|uniref:Lon N-terminal domain-containing protein n=1 Tax=Williamsia serinedens TaxID=391736 RepID=A0ABT1H535_9NOCA|nr:LON peptidase substrate-binding domain-containing protein [Williamsia serinedens]MBE7161728.1 LON peptidase substrate-binding domain-containing protein [Williamsia herbipolensis]MCP2161740.1 hypothetical protein [Williamsia serinedens]